MTCLQAFLAGFVLGLGLARVSPSGKARASQARMRGFESRHPLQNNLRPAFGSEPPPMGGGSFKGGLFWFTSLRTSADSARLTSPQQSIRCKNKNPDTFATFFSIRNSLSSLQSKNEPEFRWLPAVLRLGLRSKRLTTIPNRKNLANQTDFLFLDPKTASHQRSGQDRAVVIPQAGQGGRDATGGMGRS